MTDICYDPEIKITKVKKKSKPLYIKTLTRKENKIDYRISAMKKMLDKL
jgi:chaperonin cofactor prefoldin